MGIDPEYHHVIYGLTEEKIFNFHGLKRIQDVHGQSENNISVILTTFLNGMMKKISLLLLCFLLLDMALGQTSNLFESEEIPELTLRCDLRTVLKDRGEDPQYHEAILQYRSTETTFSIPIRIKARGNFRKLRSNC